MPKVKDFDCVERKNRIQAELPERYQGMTEEEIRADQDRRIEADPILGPLHRRLTGKEGAVDESTGSE
jgi:hypothetical protein